MQSIVIDAPIETVWSEVVKLGRRNSALMDTVLDTTLEPGGPVLYRPTASRSPTEPTAHARHPTTDLLINQPQQGATDMPYVNYIELNVSDVAATADFYSTVFGWKTQQFADDYMVATHGDEPGIDTGIQPVQGGGGPSSTPVVSVASIDDTLAKVVEAGGTVVVDKFPIPGVGHAAYFVDPGGLQMGVHQPESAQT